MSKEVLGPEKTRLSLEQLSVAANTLNTVSDQLGSSVAHLDSALGRLNLGVSSWVELPTSYQDEDRGVYLSEEVGYAKIHGRWGIGLRVKSGEMVDEPQAHSSNEWLFTDAPRDLRVRAVPYLPALLNILGEEANEFAERIRASEQKVREIANLVERMAPSSVVAKPAKRS